MVSIAGVFWIIEYLAGDGPPSPAVDDNNDNGARLSFGLFGCDNEGAEKRLVEYMVVFISSKASSGCAQIISLNKALLFNSIINPDHIGCMDHGIDKRSI